MIKKKTSKKQKFSLKNIQQADIKEKAFKELNPEEYFKDPSNVAIALLQALQDNDIEAYLEILDSYLRVNRRKIAKKPKISEPQLTLKQTNPTIKTLAKIVHAATLPTIKR